jgi:hypothetical protein
VRYLVERTPCSRAAIRQEAIHVNAWKDFTANLAKSNGDVLGCWGVLATRAKAKAKSDTQRAVTPDAFPIFAASDVAGAPAGGELIVDGILDTRSLGTTAQNGAPIQITGGRQIEGVGSCFYFRFRRRVVRGQRFRCRSSCFDLSSRVTTVFSSASSLSD